MMPRVKTRAEVETIVASAKYPPLGGRGCGIRPILTDFESTGSLSGDMDWLNQNTLVCIQIETREAMENLEDILSVPGVDATIMGPQDLSIALGTPGNHRSHVMELAVNRMIEVCNCSGVAPGIHIGNTELLLDMKRRGMRLLACGFDEGFMLQAMSQTMNLLRGSGDSPKAADTAV
jgi:2-keto-3-deoxy-L-rhamnonate aldolase RhmA